MIKKALIAVAAGTGLYALWNYFSGLKRTDAELETVVSMKVHKLDFKGLVVRVDVTLKNPAEGSFKVKYPFVKLLYKGVVVGTSTVVDRDIPLEKYSEAVADKIMIAIPIRSIFSASAGMIQSLAKEEPIKLEAKTISTIDLGWKKIPYEKTEEMILKK